MNKLYSTYMGKGYENENKVYDSSENPMESKNSKLLASFTAYCKQNPELRFWQALRDWVDLDYIWAAKNGFITDTFFWKEKNEL